MSSYFPIRLLARALHADANPWKAFMVLKACFDDSGTHANSLITALGGYVAGAAAWTGAEARWAAALADYRQHGVTWYHAPDVRAGHKEWAGVPSGVRELTPMLFARALGASDLMPVWSAVVNEDFWNFATPEFLAAYPTPFDLCYHEALRQLYRFAVNNGNVDPIVPLFSLQTEHAQRMMDRYEIASADTDLGQYLGPISFDNPRRNLPLQMADLLAHEFYHEWIAREYAVDPVWSTSPVLAEAVRARDAPYGGCYSGNGMRLAVERFMTAQQASSSPPSGSDA